MIDIHYTKLLQIIHIQTFYAIFSLIQSWLRMRYIAQLYDEVNFIIG